MGQYYKTVIKSDDGLGKLQKWSVIHPHDYDNGFKLMEHSWVGNKFVNAVVTALIDRGLCRVAHMGDYSDDSCIRVSNMRTKMEFYNKAWGKNYKNYQVYINEPVGRKDDVYIINESRQEYIRFMWQKPEGKENCWWVNAFMLLIAVGNGMGGGDYHGTNEDLVGRWAFDQIRVSTIEPEGYLKIHGWEFKEEW